MSVPPMQKTLTEQKAFAAGASIRVSGFNLDFEGITREIGHIPSHTHRQGQLNQLKEPYTADMWSLKSPLGPDKPLETHLNWLAEVLLPCKQYISQLRGQHKVDIYCYQTCYTEQASLVLSRKVLRIFTDLDFDLQVSLLCLPPESKGGGSGYAYDALE
jgi:Domain of unknown function (DUF4279)